jgi:hypothetical protein
MELLEKVSGPLLTTRVLTPFPGKLGHYHIRRMIGRGGMGIVFEAFDPLL